MPHGSDGLDRNATGRQSPVDETTSPDNVTEYNSNASSPIYYESMSEKSRDDQENDPEYNPSRSASKSKRKSEHIEKHGSGKRVRTLLTLEQSRVLHELLEETSFPTTKVREEVAAKLGLSARKVQVFFQNKRQKERKKMKLREVASQKQDVAPNKYSPSEKKELPSAAHEHISSTQTNTPSFSNASLEPSSSSVDEFSATENLYSQRSYEYFGYHNGWQARSIEQNRPRYTYPPHAASYWYSTPGIRRNMYHFVPRMSHEVEHSRKTMDPGRDTLPPIMSDIRSGAHKLPSINDMISGAHA